MNEILSNMLRRKMRTSLTVLGIVIGVFALTVMGAMSEKMNLLLSGGVQYYSSHVQVGPAGGDFTAPMPVSKARELARVPGAAAVFPFVGFALKTDGNSGGFGVPDMIVGGWTGSDVAKYEKFKLSPAEGQFPGPKQRGVIVVGSTIAREYNLHVGDTFRVRGRSFLVKAIAQTTMTAPDSAVMMNLRDAQDILYFTLPPMLRRAVKPTDITTLLNVYPKAGVSGDVLAARIKASGIKDIKVSSPSDMKKQFDQMSVIFNLIVMSSAIVALIVGALSVINTMAMSVAERVKEIGLKKAIGAHTHQILREYLAEASIMGIVGGLIGLGLGSLLVEILNTATAHTGTQLFAVTTRLAVGTLLFATILGAGAGFFPALRAARLNPVEALRAE